MRQLCGGTVCKCIDNMIYLTEERWGRTVQLTNYLRSKIPMSLISVKNWGHPEECMSASERQMEANTQI